MSSAINQMLMNQEDSGSIINQLRQAKAHLDLAELEVAGATQSGQLPEEFIAVADPAMPLNPNSTDSTGVFMSGIGRTFSINGVDTVINMGGFNLGTFQFGGAQSDGKFYAGGGAVELGADGINITAEAAAADLRAYTFSNPAGSIIGGIYGQDPYPAVNPRRDVNLTVNSASDTDSRAKVEAYAPSGFDAQVQLYAQQGAGSSNVGVNLDATTEQIDIQRAGLSIATIGKNGAYEKFHINPNTTEVYFIVEGNGDPYLIYTDPLNDRVGIGKNNPATILDVDGTVTATAADINGTVTADGLNLFGIDAVNTTSWTPSFTNLTVGNGTLTARYAVIGSVLHAWVQLVWGTTTSISGSVSCSIPTGTTTNALWPVGLATLTDTGTANYSGTVSVATTTTVSISVNNTSGTYSTSNNLSSTVPFTWGDTDVLRFSFTIPLV